MKHHFLTLATITTLLLLLSTPPTTTAANAADNIVYDVIGEPLQAGQTYYMVPYDYSDVGGGGLTWLQKTKVTCAPYYVSQENVNTNFGQKIAFYPQTTGQTDITLSSILNIVFSSFTPPINCPGTSNVWSVAADPATRLNFIELRGSRGTRDLRTWFTIEDVDQGGYKISYCPRNRRVDCGSLGIVSRDFGRWLGVNGTNPLTFVFESEEFFLNKALGTKSYAA
ncbi:hypothetical protein BVRB_3g059350 [Beta vulgaris subsp. vulgaris]|nr:hypothetical protein BVRB_3g059350 [Beta vulgaris subsp. vulgaris]